MSEADLIKILSERFFEGFADTVAREVCAAGAFDVLYSVATDPYAATHSENAHSGNSRSGTAGHVGFRAAYVFERIYFGNRELFMPYAADFCQCDFAACKDASARRHFGKIMADLLKRYTPDAYSFERIAETAADWAVDKRNKVAVRIWAVEILMRCRKHVSWVDESWPDIMETMSLNATPGIKVRLRKNWLPSKS